MIKDCGSETKIRGKCLQNGKKTKMEKRITNGTGILDSYVRKTKKGWLETVTEYNLNNYNCTNSLCMCHGLKWDENAKFESGRRVGSIQGRWRNLENIH